LPQAAEGGAAQAPEAVQARVAGAQRARDAALTAVLHAALSWQAARRARRAPQVRPDLPDARVTPAVRMAMPKASRDGSAAQLGEARRAVVEPARRAAVAVAAAVAAAAQRRLAQRRRRLRYHRGSRRRRCCRRCSARAGLPRGPLPDPRGTPFRTTDK